MSGCSSAGGGFLPGSSSSATAADSTLVLVPKSDETIKTHFIVREGTYRQMSANEYFRSSASATVTAAGGTLSTSRLGGSQYSTMGSGGGSGGGHMSSNASGGATGGGSGGGGGGGSNAGANNLPCRVSFLSLSKSATSTTKNRQNATSTLNTINQYHSGSSTTTTTTTTGYNTSSIDRRDVTAPLGSMSTIGSTHCDRVAFNIGRELYVYPFLGTKKVHFFTYLCTLSCILIFKTRDRVLISTNRSTNGSTRERIPRVMILITLAPRPTVRCL